MCIGELEETRSPRPDLNRHTQTQRETNSGQKVHTREDKTVETLGIREESC